MAYDDSGELPIASDPSEKNTYGLGGYNFELKVQNTHEPGEPDVVSVFAICRGPDGNRQTQAMDFPAGTTVEGWYVEANETEASVYVKTKDNTQPPDISPYTMPIQTGGSWSYYRRIGTFGQRVDFVVDVGSNAIAADGNGLYFLGASTTPESSLVVGTHTLVQDGTTDNITVSATQEYTYAGKTAYYGVHIVFHTVSGENYNHLHYHQRPNNDGAVAWAMLYGEGLKPEPVDTLVGRFAIDLSEADGGPDGDWDEPGDTGDPSYTLNVSVTGASSGSNSGIPLEAQEQTTYGSGGYGGNGGGGGAGASTVIIYEFATDLAESVQQEAISRGPGTGGLGGKGGKGGDGCILIFY